MGATGASGGSTADTLTVWLQVDARSGWPEVVAAANAQFKYGEPRLGRRRPVPGWNTHLGKFDSTLAGGSAPDVIEMGNTEMTKYMAAGAFQDLTADKASFANSSTWLAGLAASGRFGGKLYGVPYYAGSRLVTYRTDLFRQAGINRPPTSLAEFTAAAKKLGARNEREDLLARLHRRNRLVRRHELRLRPRRQDRHHEQGQVDRHARSAEGDRRLGRVQALLRCRVHEHRRRRSRRGPTRTTSTRRATRRR